MQSYERLLSLRGQFHDVTNPIVSTARNKFTLRTLVDLASGQEEKQRTQHEVESDESDQCENRISGADNLAVAVLGVKEAVDEPWLTAEFGRGPSECVGDIGKRQGQHQTPKEPGVGFQPAAPYLEG